MADYKNEFGWFAEKPKVEKKIYDRNKVAIGIVVFLVIFTIAFWKNLGKAVPPPKPALETAAIIKLPEKERTCVEDVEFMRQRHMRLLVDWREQVIRDGERYWTNSKGEKYLASLSNTCMECHTNKTQFCDQCHNYVAVVPNCWGCHLTKEEQVAKAEAK
ncbi:MAG: sulfate reduction electron transfer complex DsrMKJOP subunit DsrJ [Deltaproteobacteria bacterium]|nr:sulfate reduction electron transfer complex DsrMKJOP subunit DsrJ [Deltaproteobacteria bacterium]